MSGGRRWFEDGALHFALGIEDTFVPQTRAGERAIDEYELTEHYRAYREDLGLAVEAGAQMLRWGIPWHRVNPEPGRWDFGWVDRVMGRFSELGLRPIVDLLHYGTPTWLEGEFAHRDYPARVAEYSVTVAERYADTVTDYTPVNEPMIHALFCGEYGYWPPYLSGSAGLVTIVDALARGFVLAQRGIAEVLGDRATFVHVDAGMRYVGDLDGEHARLAGRLAEQVFLVEDLVTGGVGPDHPLAGFLAEHGMSDERLSWFADRAVQPDIMGVNYYPRHSTEVLRDGVHQSGGFADPRPAQDDGGAGLAELLRSYAQRFDCPVMVTETAVTGTVAERIAWLDESVDLVRRLRGEGLPVVGYTWWPLFDMYEWTYRHTLTPRSASLLPMGLWDLVEAGINGLQRRRNPVADRFRLHATDVAGNAPSLRTAPERNT